MSGASLHASAVVVGEVCAVLRGPSGAGKSAAAMALIDLARARGQFAGLVADDRVRLAVRGGRLIASPHPAIAGKIERRGEGIGEAAHLSAAVVGLIVDIAGRGESWPRLPEASDLVVAIEGVSVPRLATAGAPGEIAAAAFDRLARLTGAV